ncbi:S-layer homology domain-containing protein [Fusibacter ferrireducens]|nr:S-layer homology domain-containing protein [Fusibacter ferrireducens]
MPTVVNNSYDVVFTPNDVDNYDWSGVTLTQKVNLTVNQATPETVTWPTSASITYGQHLSDSELIGGSKTGTWAWQDSSIMPTVVNSGYDVVFTPNDTDSYDWSGVTLTQKVNLTVNQATPEAVTWPTSASITYGQRLSDSELIGGSKTGTWAWQDGSIMPTVVNNSYDVVFTPNDVDNYDWSSMALTQKINLTVNQAAPEVLTWPTSASITYGQRLGDSELIGGSKSGTWAWKDGSIMPTVANSGYDVVFTPHDIDNYDWSGIVLKKTVGIAVSKAAVSVQDPTEIPVIYNNVVSGKFNLNSIAFEPSTPGTSSNRSYEVGVTSSTDFFSVQPVVNQNFLTYSSSSSNTKDTKSTVAVTIKSENYEDATVTMTFKAVDKRDAGVNFSSTVPSAKTYGDGTFTLTASATAPGQNGAWTWVSSDPTVLNVTGNGASANVQILKSGKATITAKYESNTTLSEVSTAMITVSKTVLKVQPKNFSIDTGTAIPTLEVVYSGLKNNDTSSIISLSSGSLEMEIQKTDGTFLANTNTAGTYDIVFTGSPVFTESEKYDIAIDKGTLTIRSSGGDSSDYSRGDSSSEGSSTSTTTTPTTTLEKKPNQPIMATTPVTATTRTNGTASASIPDKAVIDAIAKAQTDAKEQGKEGTDITVALDIIMPEGTASLTAALTRSSLDSLVSAGVSSLEINDSLVQVSFDQKALAEIQKQSTGDIRITIAPKTNLSAVAKQMIGTRPVYDATVGYGNGKSVSSFGGGIATVSIPYTLGKNEAVGGLYAVYVDAKGNATRIAGSAYDANSGCVVFTTTHFSQYGIGYTAPTAKFTDISTHWAKASIDYVVGRGLLSGSTETAFAPNSAMTRGMLVTALGRLPEVDTKAYTTNSFIDVKTDSVFRPYIEWAYSKGIVQGIGNSQFAPDRAITREEMAVIFANYAKATGYTLPIVREASVYADASSIGSDYKEAVKVMQQAGLMTGGSDDKFNPKGNATRAEVSSILERYIKLTINPATAKGWAQNDAGQYLYYKDGKALTDTQTIDGVKYFFNTDGTLKTGWVKDSDNWRYYSGKTMVVGFWDLGANGNNKTYYFTKDGLMVSDKWLEIDGKRYYFNTDGSLVKNIN